MNETKNMIEIFNNIKEIVQRYDTQEIFDVDLMSSEIKDFILADRKRIVEPLVNYVEHDGDCIAGQSSAGRPTEDGGYETLYGYGKYERWYKTGEKPECTCGLDQTLKNAGID